MKKYCIGVSAVLGVLGILWVRGDNGGADLAASLAMILPAVVSVFLCYRK